MNNFIDTIKEFEETSKYNLNQVLEKLNKDQEKEKQKSEKLTKEIENIQFKILYLEEQIKINTQDRIDNEKTNKELLGNKIIIAKLKAEVEFAEISKKLKNQEEEMNKEFEIALHKARMEAEKSVIESEKEIIKERKKQRKINEINEKNSLLELEEELKLAELASKISLEKASKIDFIKEELERKFYETIAILKKENEDAKKNIDTHLENMRSKLKEL